MGVSALCLQLVDPSSSNCTVLSGCLSAVWCIRLPIWVGGLCAGSRLVPYTHGKGQHYMYVHVLHEIAVVCRQIQCLDGGGEQNIDNNIHHSWSWLYNRKGRASSPLTLVSGVRRLTASRRTSFFQRRGCSFIQNTPDLFRVYCAVQHNLANTAYSLGMSRCFAGLKLMFIDPDTLPCRNWPTNRVENRRKPYPARGRHMQQILSSAAVYTMYYKFTDVNGRFYLPLTPIVEPACPHARGWTGDANPTRQLEP